MARHVARHADMESASRQRPHAAHAHSAEPLGGVLQLQRTAGNMAIQRLLASRDEGAPVSGGLAAQIPVGVPPTGASAVAEAGTGGLNVQLSEASETEESGLCC